MSERTSPISPRSPQTSDELFAFEGVDALVQAWRDGLTPDPALTVSEWADRHRFLSPRASAEPGRYRTDRTPYMRAIMDALSPGNAARRIVFMKAAQVGATEAGNNWIGYVIHHAPGPMLAVQPTVELAKRFSRQRIDPLIAESPVLRERVKPQRSRDAGSCRSRSRRSSTDPGQPGRSSTRCSRRSRPLTPSAPPPPRSSS